MFSPTKPEISPDINIQSFPWVSTYFLKKQLGEVDLLSKRLIFGGQLHIFCIRFLWGWG